MTFIRQDEDENNNQDTVPDHPHLVRMNAQTNLPTGSDDQDKGEQGKGDQNGDDQSLDEPPSLTRESEEDSTKQPYISLTGESQESAP